jgi:hypothetical protein
MIILCLLLFIGAIITLILGNVTLAVIFTMLVSILAGGQALLFGKRMRMLDDAYRNTLVEIDKLKRRKK